MYTSIIIVSSYMMTGNVKSYVKYLPMITIKLYIVVAYGEKTELFDEPD